MRRRLREGYYATVKVHQLKLTGRKDEKSELTDR